MTARLLPPLAEGIPALVHHLRPGADPNNDDDCKAVGHTVIAINARDQQIQDALSALRMDAAGNFSAEMADALDGLDARDAFVAGIAAAAERIGGGK